MREIIRMAIAVALCTSPVQAADAWSVKAGDAPPKDVPESLRTTLDAKGLAVHHGDAAILELWLRAEIPSSADADQIKNGITYREIPETTFLGIVRFPKAFTDYRKQEIKAGTYSLRMAVQPETGDHKETAPHADFALLVPIAKETSPDTIDAKDLYTLSRGATGGDHPGVMLLFPAKKAKKEAAIVDRGDGVMTLDVLRTVAANGTATTLGFGITVAGVSKTR